ncbi:MAG: phage holin family protein [Burkholderiales bacterium]|nr:phage holin family protein [Burkholderiales bacterium]MDE1928577.1 phage holin family protein [Burkholderiales bacterium]MDE2158594.1 phage holin family protein [Burkholderiales bacterium]MDE2503285.1 phage holin family protein [Burkholderiales bacterium]
MLQSLRPLAALAATMARSRIELAGLELGEALERSVVNGLLGLAALGLALLALLTATALAVLLADEGHRAAVLAALLLLYLAGGVGMLLVLRSRLRKAPPLLAATLAELQQDVQTLGHP